jgi:predicted nucleic acid-binding protein
LRLYFDNDVYNRPFDDRSIPRNRAEARAVEQLFEKIVAGDLELVSSFVVEVEHSRLAESVRRERVGDLIELARGYVGPGAEISPRTAELEGMGFGRGDAMHLAAAELSGSDYFVTCDDKLLRRARRIGLPIPVVSPLELLREETR